MSKDILVTIGIPTFNGDKYIREAINSVISQLTDQVTQVEILISDNGSTDSTTMILSEYLEKYPNIIRYYKNEHNVGYDLNVDLLIKRARGKYVWLLGDDDYLCMGSVNKVLNVINCNCDLSVLLLSVGFLDIETEQPLEIKPQFSQDILCNTGDHFFQISRWATAAMSSLIINKNNWNSIDLSKYLGSQWIHIGGIINILKGKNVYSYIFHEEMVVVRTNNLRWAVNNGNQFKVGLCHLRILREMLSLGYDKSSYKFFLENRFVNNLRDMRSLCRIKNIKEFYAILQSMIILFKCYPSFWLLHLPIFILLVPLNNCKRYLRKNHE